MKLGLLGSCLLALVVFASGARAQEAPAAAAPEKPAAPAAPAAAAEPAASKDESAAAPPKDDAEAGAKEGGAAEPDFGHGMQFGLRVGIVAGYRMVFRYDKSPFCRQPDPNKQDKDQQKLCGHWAPPALDLALSFAPLDFVEPYAWLRLGLSGEEQTDTKPLVAIGAGARIHTTSDSQFKVFVEPAIAAEIEDGQGSQAWLFTDDMGVKTAPEYKTDLLFHLAVGPQYDFLRYFGIYAHAGITTGVLRAIHTELELSFGIQGRAP